MAAANNETVNMAVFCDFENIAIGVRESKYEKFDIRLVRDKLAVKGSIVVRKAYCDWARYKDFKATMHEEGFELIDIPHVRQSGKNSADIRMVVDALDLCYTKPHVDTFVLITGDSDFSPLVSKLRENNKLVIALGVKASTSDLLIRNCDEFIYYDDLVRSQQKKQTERQTGAAKKTGRAPAKPAAAPRAATLEAPAPEAATAESVPAEATRPADAPGAGDKLQAALDLVAETVTAMANERGGDERIMPGTLKQAIKRRDPGFDESFYGFSMFSKMLAEAERRGMLRLTRDDKTGQYLVRPGAVEG
jgi:uncharacterized protein (TIGR00288 family)